MTVESLALETVILAADQVLFYPPICLSIYPLIQLAAAVHLYPVSVLDRSRMLMFTGFDDEYGKLATKICGAQPRGQRFNHVHDH